MRSKPPEFKENGKFHNERARPLSPLVIVME
jgi:hypothetical protein